MDEVTGATKFIKGKLSTPSNDEPENIARDFLKENEGLLDLQQGLVESLSISQVEKDRQGFSHVYFAQSLNGIPVFEKRFSLFDVYSADEAFITGTFAGTTPVREADGRSIATLNGPVTQRLSGLYKTLVDDHLTPIT